MPTVTVELGIKYGIWNVERKDSSLGNELKFKSKSEIFELTYSMASALFNAQKRFAYFQWNGKKNLVPKLMIPNPVLAELQSAQ